MADEDCKKLALAAPLLPQHVMTIEKKTTTSTKTPPPSPIPAVELVGVWALLTAAIFLGSFAFTIALAHHDIYPPSWMLPRAGGLTDAAEAEMGALFPGMMWSSAAQAAVAAAALLLPGRWSGSRRALAYVAFAVTAAGHLVMARLLALFLTADLGNIYTWIVAYSNMSFLVKGDLECVVALLGRGEYAN